MEIQRIAELIAYVVVAFLWMWIAKKAFDIRNGFADHEIEENSNIAVGLRRAGVYLGITLGLYGIMSTPAVGGFGADLAATMIDGAVLTVLILVAAWIANAVLLHGIDNRAAVRGGNVAVGLVELCAFIATGFIAMSSFGGVGGGVLAAVVFFALGQLALVVLVILYEKLTPFNALGEIGGGNAAAGLMVGGMLIALGIVLAASLAGDFTSWTTDITSFVISAAIGIIVLLAILKPIDWIFLPNTDFRTEIERDRNVAAIAVASSVQIAVALVITAIIV
ncbi:MAG TPA: DUF350 domain-containing protein [Longimicrobiales bacterium]